MSMNNGRHLAFPFRIGTDGRTATPADLPDHIRGEIIQLLLTAQGERPFLPSFGAGLRRLVFQRNDDATAGITKALVSQNLSRWLGQRIVVELLDVSSKDSTLNVDLRYRIIATGEVISVRLQRQGAH
ncbi:MAG: GPW/gp25 family protein [Aquabacterium sp.]|uniref:GPW/gp25 family protein n=1 Tax=Aquabacterium sp. TaxID=1872578 RepID=UPI00271CEBA2|nr:GPW/gp25 family protein [Aquabacterium sp.]MDO9006133.1 GPW/gp25 family protein [Aquabacterium sp.]